MYRDDVGLLGRMVRTRLAGRPLFLSHLVTARCNGRCAFCLWRFGAEDDERLAAAELTTGEIDWLYRAAAKAGVCYLALWGGEPLLRADIEEILRSAAAARLSVVLMTNGWLLPELWPRLRGLVRTLILSLDDAGDDFDRLRGMPGLFDRLDRFVVGLRADPERPRLLVNAVLSRLNPGALTRVAPIAQRWGAGLYFCPMDTGQMGADGFDNRLANLALGPEDLREAARRARELKRRGYPFQATNKFLRLLERDPGLHDFTCRFPHAALTVLPDGSFRDCTHRDVPLASVRDLRAAGSSLEALFRLPRYAEMLREAANCTACNNPDVIETSWGWRLCPSMLWRSLTLSAR